MTGPDLPLSRLPGLLADLELRGDGLRDSHYKMLTLAPQPADDVETNVIRLMTGRWREEVKNLVFVETQLQRWHKAATTHAQRQQLKQFEAALERYRAYVTSNTLAAERLLEAPRSLDGPFVARPLSHLVVLEEWIMDASENARAILEPMRQAGDVISQLDADLRERLDWTYNRVEVDARAFLKVVESWRAEVKATGDQMRLTRLKGLNLAKTRFSANCDEWIMRRCKSCGNEG